MTKLWGGRFSQATHQLVEGFTGSIHYDQKLARYDCLGSLAHINVLRQARIISAAEHAQLKKGLNKILKAIADGTFKASSGQEDIHSYIQDLLQRPDHAGAAALKLHSCRSRNDQVVIDMKLYCLDQILTTERCLIKFCDALTVLAQRYSHVYLPGYTHLQHAIPVAFSDYCHAYIKMLERDETRLLNAFDNIELAMGAGALAGTMIPAEHYVQASGLKVNKTIVPADCPLDTVSDRDFVAESLFVLSTIGMHLSRLAEDWILWSTQEFAFLEMADAFCTGSSLMPQKKNPDILELIRGYAGRLHGNLTSVMMMMKGLPLSYNRDMQLDKEPLFESFRIVQDELALLAELFGHVTLNEENIRRQLDDETLYATDIADHLVLNKVPFQEAHRIVGQLVRHKLTQGVRLAEMTDSELSAFHPSLNARVVKAILDPQHSVQAKRSINRNG